MAKRKELTYCCMVEIDGAEAVPLESLTPEQLAYCRRVWTERIAQTVNDYYRKHPEEYYARYGQKKAMREQGWSVDEFVWEFGRNYLSDEEIAELEKTERDEPEGVFLILDAALLPY